MHQVKSFSAFCAYRKKEHFVSWKPGQFSPLTFYNPNLNRLFFLTNGESMRIQEHYPSRAKLKHATSFGALQSKAYQ